MFHDRVRIHVQAGRGTTAASISPGEAFSEGGPDGGDGGPGGDVVLAADHDLRDLSAFRRNRHQGRPRRSGGGALKHGADGRRVELRVPVGTQVFDEDEQLIADLAIAPRARSSRAAAAAARQQALRDADAAGTALRGDGLAGEEARSTCG